MKNSAVEAHFFSRIFRFLPDPGKTTPDHAPVMRKFRIRMTGRDRDQNSCSTFFMALFTLSISLFLPTKAKTSVLSIKQQVKTQSQKTSVGL